MSKRGSRSADFIGGFKRYDYAVDILTESYLLRLKERIEKLSDIGDLNSARNFEKLVKCLNELKVLMKSIKNETFEARINHIIFNPKLKDTKEFIKQLLGIQEDAIKIILEMLQKLRTNPAATKKIIPKVKIEEKPKEAFTSQIYFIDNDSLNKLDANTLLNYVKRIKGDYKKVKFKHIKKPSLDHLFKSTENCKDKLSRLRTIILLIQKDLDELERMDFKAGFSN